MAWADSVLTTLSLKEKVASIMIVDTLDNAMLSDVANSRLPMPGFYKFKTTSDRVIHTTKWSSLSSLKVYDLRNGFKFQDVESYFPDEKTLSLVDKSLRDEVDGLFYRHWRNQGFCLNSYTFSKDFVSREFEPRSYYLPALRLWLPNDSKAPAAFNVYPVPRHFIGIKASRLPVYSIYKKSISGIVPFRMIHQRVLAEWSVEELLKAGTLFYSRDYTADLSRLAHGFESRWLPVGKLNDACRIVLAARFEWSKKSKFRSVTGHPSDEERIIHQVYENSIMVLQKSVSNPLPLHSLSASIKIIGTPNDSYSSFIAMAQNYYDKRDVDSVDFVFWLMSDKSVFEGGFNSQLGQLKASNPKAQIVAIWAGHPGLLPFREMPEGLDAAVLSWSNNALAWEKMAQVVYGGIGVKIGAWPKWLPESLKSYAVALPALRLKYGLPQEVGLNADSLAVIDSIVGRAIDEAATPGAQVLVARNGVVVYQKSFGWHTYKKEQRVQNSDLYDLASVTKVIGTLPILMRLYDEGRWRLTDSLSLFLPQVDTTDKAGITLRELLLHESGMPAFIPFYQHTIDTTRLEGPLLRWGRNSRFSIQMDENLFMNKTAVYRDDLYRPQRSDSFSIRVAQGLYLLSSYRDTIYKSVLNATLKRKHYLYSDLNFMLLQKVAEELTDSTLDALSYRWFFDDMGATTLRYNVWQYFPLRQIVPTENDQYFRKQLLQGDVHDPGAAMMGGVSGHAGLFGNANDLAKVMQMFLNDGTYGGKRYLNMETVRFFSSRQHILNRRGLGFDKPETDTTKVSPAGLLVSPSSFGHSGFSGTMVWADPATGLLYIFLSNRIHPAAYNNKLGRMNIRTEVQDAIYRALEY
ncbi:serine hydrolase domain-containing protein [Geofilum sp. OHC36d9]|uniref:serine hydrolase domain-containing protein n=1 Tax=Geofilum sp. OHC36d9 TaxID=3458413 RepID=UPI0040333AE7